MPIAIAENLPAMTFPLSVIFILKKRSMRSWATAPEAATIRPLTVPRTVANAIAEMIANKNTPNDFASSGADMLESVRSSTPLVMAPRPMNRVNT